MERSQKGIFVSGPDCDHTIYYYTEDIFKIVQWKIPRLPVVGERAPAKHYDHKLAPSLSRARSVVLQLALCNDWDYFCTFTIDSQKCDRTDLDSWYKSFSQWIRDLRKKGENIEYILVPERHLDGSWHAHGLFRGLRPGHLVTFKEWDRAGFRSPNGKRLPVRLINSDYETWPDYYQKFGNNSFGLIRSKVGAAFYIEKYITKDLERSVSQVGKHLYYASRGLNRAVKHVEFYGRSFDIDRFLVNDYEFCKTGFTKVSDSVGWSFALQYMDFSDLDPIEPFQGFDPELVSDAEAFLEFDQLRFWR